MNGFFHMLKDFLLIVKAEFKRDLLYMKRYPLEPLSFLFFMYMILIAVLVGFSQLLPDGGRKLLNQELMILGYCLMQFVMATQMGWSGQIQNESQTGTLEQLSISGHTLGGVLLSRGIAQFPRQVLSFFLLLLAYKVSIPEANIRLDLFYKAIPILFITAIGIFGVSYVFAGITLLFKRVGFFFQIINFAFLGLFWQNRAKLEEGSVTALLYDIFPPSVGLANLREVLIQSGGQTAEHSLSTGPLYLLMISLLSVGLGYFAFYRMEIRARRQALLSQY